MARVKESRVTVLSNVSCRLGVRSLCHRRRRFVSFAWIKNARTITVRHTSHAREKTSRMLDVHTTHARTHTHAHTALFIIYEFTSCGSRSRAEAHSQLRFNASVYISRGIVFHSIVISFKCEQLDGEVFRHTLDTRRVNKSELRSHKFNLVVCFLWLPDLPSVPSREHKAKSVVHPAISSILDFAYINHSTAKWVLAEEKHII